jgi:heavy metal translocating P-type ATPase
MVCCDLCGLDCGKHPLTQRIAGKELSFCCFGCVNVYVILSESGTLASGQSIRETELFKSALALGLISQAEREPSRSQAAAPAPSGCQEMLLDVGGMWCSSCAWLIEHVLNKVPGVVSTEVSFASDTAKVVYQPQLVPSDDILGRVNRLGYSARIHSDENPAVEEERRDLLVRTGLAFFFWLNIMTFSLAVYASYFEPIADSARRFVPFLLMALATPVVFYCAQPILKLAWRGLLTRTVRMETLLALGILAAYLFSSVQAFRGETHVYFDTASAIVALVLAGKSIERTAKDRTTFWLSSLHRMLPNKVRIASAGQERLVALDALQPGQMFVVKPGERIPADGIVAAGDAHVDESLLTGESRPVNKRPGSAVLAGSVNADGVLQIRATRVAGDSTISQIVSTVTKALAGRSDLERTVDRVARVFVPAVIVIALGTFAICWTVLALGLGQSLMRSITVLVIACPCALGLATPLAITAAVGTASRHGILVTDSGVLERLSKIDAVVFDKTGTITEGRFSLLEYQISIPACESEVLTSATAAGNQNRPSMLGRNGSPQQQWRDAFARIAAVESYSEHPVGKAIVSFADSQPIERLEAAGIKVHKGAGITGSVAGEPVFVGNRRMLRQLGASVNDDAEQAAARWEQEGKTVSFFGSAAQVDGVLAFGDKLRDDAVAVISELRRSGIAVYLLSGDSQLTTQWVAARVEADYCRAECLPEQKAEIVRELQSQGSVVAMIGDGINDAPALAQADLGIAMGSGTDIAMNAAAVVLMSSSLDKVLEVFRLARKSMRVVRQNLFWAFAYNIVGISLAVLGMLNPILAAGAMLLSSVSVTGNSLRMGKVAKSSNG